MKQAKQCPAIQDIVSEGFIIPAWQDIYFVKDGKFMSWRTYADKDEVSSSIRFQGVGQLTDMPTNHLPDYGILKLISPYFFSTPEGYGIYFTDPFYHFRKDIRCLPGIVEADKWGYVAFPFEILSDNFVMEAGTPLIHCLVYKREEPLNLVMDQGTQKDYDEMYADMFELFSSDKNYRTK